MSQINEELHRIFWRGKALFLLKPDASVRGQSSEIVVLLCLIPLKVYTEGLGHSTHAVSTLKRSM